jgi:hypothetical protein
LLAIILLAQAAALVSENHAHRATEHCCLLCHVSQPYLEASAPAAVAPLIYVRWLAPDPSFEFFHDVFLPSGFSRGPPSLS